MRMLTAAVLMAAFVLPAHAADKQEVAAHVFSFAATVGDIELTHAALRSGVCHELDPLYGRYPNRTRLYATGIPLAVAASLLAHHLKNTGSKRWAWAPLLNGGAHASGLLVTSFNNCYKP